MAVVPFAGALSHVLAPEDSTEFPWIEYEKAVAEIQRASSGE
jgi:hypothetical protein